MVKRGRGQAERAVGGIGDSERSARRLVILADDNSGDVYVAYVDGETGEIITATRALAHRDVPIAFAFHAGGGDTANVTEGAPEYMDCGDIGWLNTRHLRPMFLDQFGTEDEA